MEHDGHDQHSVSTGNLHRLCTRIDFWEPDRSRCAGRFTLLALWQMAVGARYDGSVHDGVAYESIDFHTVRCLQALAGFGGGFKILYFLRGMDFASFLINMLEHIMRDMIDFIVVLLVIIVMYMYVFHLLLHAPQGPGLDDPLAASGDNNMGFPLAPMTADHFPYNETDVQVMNFLLQMMNFAF